jgi:hypothetical protein
MPWSVLVFLLGFAVLVVIVSFYFLMPAMDAATDTGVTDVEKRRLMAYSRLLLVVVLFVLFAGLVMTFRIGRFFFPRPTSPRTSTKYVDAWAESAKRVEIPPDDEGE